MTKQINSIVVGCGRIGSDFELILDTIKPHSHAGAYSSCERIDLVAGVDNDRDSRIKFEKQWNIPCFKDLESIPNPDSIGCLSVCTPPETHMSMIKKALCVFPNLGVIWCEKPVGTSLEELTQIQTLVKKAGVSICVNTWRRWDPLHQLITSELSEGTIGRVQTITAQAHVGVMNTGIHLFDLINQYVCSIPKCVMGKVVPDSSCDPGVVGMIHYENGVTAFIDMLWRENQRFGMTIQGERGRIECYSSGVLLDKAWVITNKARVLERHSTLSPMLVAVENICDHLLGGIPLESDCANAMMAMGIVAAFYQSNDTCQEAARPVKDQYFKKHFKSRHTSLTRDGLVYKKRE